MLRLVLRILAGSAAGLLVWRYVVRVLVFARAGLRRLRGSRAAVVITGCDSGFGRLVAVELHRLGATVFAGCLSEASCRELHGKYGKDRMRAFLLDVRKNEDVERAVGRVRKSALPLLGVVNNAGISAFGWAEALDVKTYQRNMDVNFFGVVRMTRAFLPLLRKHRGRLVNMGSIGARMPSAFGSAYLSTKAAMTSYSESVRQEVHRFGVKVSLVEPGFFATELLSDGSKAGGIFSVDPPGYPAYAEKMANTAEPIRKMEWLNGHDCRKVTGAVVDALLNRFPLARYTVGYDARLIRHFLVFLPSWVVDYAQTLQD